METKNLAPCGIIVSFVLNSCSPMFEISKPSITIAPLAGSTNLNNATVNELLPAPVLPTIPTFSPPWILALMAGHIP